jgi:hypothetical protein
MSLRFQPRFQGEQSYEWDVIPSREDGEGPHNCQSRHTSIRVLIRADVRSLTSFGMTRGFAFRVENRLKRRSALPRATSTLERLTLQSCFLERFNFCNFF